MQPVIRPRPGGFEAEEATVLTYATHAAFEFSSFYRSALIHGISPKLLGWNSPRADALRAKVTAVANEIADYDDGRIVLFVDSFDVLFLDPLSVIIERFRAQGSPVLFSAEKGCYPSQELAPFYPASATPWRYLNAGAYIGYAGPLKALLREMQALPGVSADAMDQQLATLVYLFGSGEIALDHGCAVFMNIHLSQWDVRWTGQRYRNRVTGTFPSILHFNGNAKNDYQRFSRRLHPERLRADLSRLGPLEAEVLARQDGAVRSTRSRSVQERCGSLLWLAYTGLLQLKAWGRERMGGPLRAGDGGPWLTRMRRVKEVAGATAARHGIVLSAAGASSLRNQYYRHLYRRRILDSPSFACPPGTGEFDLRIVAGESDYLDALWTLKTFLAFSARPAHVVVHDDGSLSPGARARLARHLVGATFISRAQADREMATLLREHPRCARFRARTRPNGLKLLDVALLGPGRPFILLDSDVLFFRAPEELLGHAAAGRPCFISDGQNAYSFPRHQLEEAVGRPLLERVNSGIIYAEAATMDLPLLERYFGFVQSAGQISWLAWRRLEQTAWALLLAAGNREAARLGPAYQISGAPLAPETVSHHFIKDGSRIDFWDRGLRRLHDDRFLDRLGRAGGIERSSE